MIAYHGYPISPNQLETGEGFLICRNVPIARTGEQEYLGREIGLTGADADRPIKVRRPPEEVFADTALASFEGKPVTDDHPPGLIGPDDVAVYEKGHAHNVRQGSGEWMGYVLADLHIHDRTLIEAIQNGKREISCGYACEYIRGADGTYSQKDIIGNHIAVVERGRAGKRAAILDSDIAKNKEANRPGRRTMKKRGLIFNLFGQAVKDKSSEEIEQLAMDAADALDEETTPPPKEGTPKEEKKEDPGAKMAEDAAAIDRVVDQVMAKLAAKGAEKAAKKKEEAKDSLDAAIEALSKDTAAPEGDSSGADGGAARVVPAEGADKGCGTDKGHGMDRAMAAGILKAMRPSVAAIQDEAQRKAVADALIGLVTAKDGRDDTAAILKASQGNAQRMADSRPAAMDMDAIQALYDSQNPHKRKESER